jgi:hypothetical protein
VRNAQKRVLLVRLSLNIEEVRRMVESGAIFTKKFISGEQKAKINQFLGQIYSENDYLG